MHKLFKGLIAGALALGMAACSSGTKTSDTIKATYNAYTTGYDWGCGTNKVTLTLNAEVNEVDASNFTVKETKQVTDFTDEKTPVIESTLDRKVLDAYLVDKDGNKTKEASQYVALELYVSPNDGSPLLYTVATGLNTWSDPYKLDIQAIGLKSGDVDVTTFTVDTDKSTLTTQVDDIPIDEFTAKDKTTYQYAHYDVKDSDKLIVWLHGGGEGGNKTVGEATNAKVVQLANKVTALYGDDFQKTVGGASILVPQCPTFWMDPTGEGKKLENLDDYKNDSYYRESLLELIKDYASKVNAKQIVLAGCSNGGFMTMVMGYNYPDEWAGLVPICEAAADKSITDDQIKALKDVPMYFIYSEDDTTVDPKIYEIPTIKILKDTGKKNLYVSTTKHVIGTYTDEKGKEVKNTYSGHWSWIYFDNNESVDNSTGLKSWDFIAQCFK